MEAFMDDSNFKKSVFIFLDELRESGVTNMFGARPYVVDEFGMEPDYAGKLIAEWMKTFGERHPE